MMNPRAKVPRKNKIRAIFLENLSDAKEVLGLNKLEALSHISACFHSIPSSAVHQSKCLHAVFDRVTMLPGVFGRRSLGSMRSSLFHASLSLVVVFILACLQTARAEAPASPTHHTLRQQWALAKYQTPADAQLPLLKNLVQEATLAAERSPRDPSVLAWKGTILSTYASVKGGVEALQVLREAKTALEDSIAIDDSVEQGLAHAVLGAMYYRVPSWPIGFKDTDKAKKHLQRALALDPTGVDANYFYGDFMRVQHQYQAAENYLSAALNAPSRATQELADEGRRIEAARALEEVEQELS